MEYELKQVQVRLRLAEAEPLYSPEPITDSDRAVEVMARMLSEMDREYVCVVNLDTQKYPINFNIVSIGDLDQAQIPIQNLFKSALLSNAKSILALHCHPSGSLSPSQTDLDVTRRMTEAGHILGIPVTDHIIVAGGTGLHTSIRGLNPELFQPQRSMGLGDVKKVAVKPDHSTKHRM
ncbi:MAG: JAB domain-containing protein [Lachnospiraceae bacterium]|nr:JAB domain-containing protein [Lachnospiraceae bacterium]